MATVLSYSNVQAYMHFQEADKNIEQKIIPKLAAAQISTECRLDSEFSVQQLEKVV